MIKKEIVINSRKFDNSIDKSWKAELLEKTDSALVLLGTFEKTVNHQDLGVIRRDTVSYEYFFLDRWFNVFKFYNPDKSFRNFYCNINLPPNFRNDVLDYIDLDIDVIVWEDFSYKILDIEEFEINSAKFEYPEDIKNHAFVELDNLINDINNRAFPFHLE